MLASYEGHQWSARRPSWFIDHESGVLQAFHSVLQNATKNMSSASSAANCSVIDVGTNAGFYSLMSAAYGCTVYGFEIQANCIDWLSRGAVQDNVQDKIHLFQNPVSSQVKHLRIKYSDQHACDGNFGFTREDCPKCDHHQFATERTFNTTTLDSAFGFLLGSGAGAGAAPKQPTTSAGAERSESDSGSVTLYVANPQIHQITFINLLKVDVEGHDVEVIRGARHLLQKRLIHHLIVEIVPSMWPSLHSHTLQTAHATTVTTGVAQPQPQMHSNSNKRNHASAVDVYVEVMSYGYSARCLTLKGGASASDSDSGNGNGSGNGSGNGNGNGKSKRVALYTKLTAAAFATHVLSEECVDWLFAASLSNEL